MELNSSSNNEESEIDTAEEHGNTLQGQFCVLRKPRSRYSCFLGVTSQVLSLPTPSSEKCGDKIPESRFLFSNVSQTHFVWGRMQYKCGSLGVVVYCGVFMLQCTCVQRPEVDV